MGTLLVNKPRPVRNPLARFICTARVANSRTGALGKVVAIAPLVFYVLWDGREHLSQRYPWQAKAISLVVPDLCPF